MKQEKIEQAISTKGQLFPSARPQTWTSGMWKAKGFHVGPLLLTYFCLGKATVERFDERSLSMHLFNKNIAAAKAQLLNWCIVPKHSVDKNITPTRRLNFPRVFTNIDMSNVLINANSKQRINNRHLKLRWHWVRRGRSFSSFLKSAWQICISNLTHIYIYISAPHIPPRQDGLDP